MNDQSDIPMRRIATIRSCYPQRFGIPRQAGLVKTASATVNFEASRDNELAVRDIESFSHLWIIFLFHKQNYTGFKPLIQPPRLGGKKTMGVYATRSPNRPNPIGLSAVLLNRVEYGEQEIRLHVLGGDFLDGTPVLDIKPYVPFADSIPEASSEWAVAAEPPMPVEWSASATAELLIADQHLATEQTGVTSGLRLLIEETLALDPRPAHERHKDGKEDQTWGMRFEHVDVKWRVQCGIAEIISVVVV